MKDLQEKYWLVRVVFLRCLAVMYAVAFLVAYNQNESLIGEHGLTPAINYLAQKPPQSNLSDLKIANPTIFWIFSPTTSNLNVCAGAGITLSLLVFALGSANIPIMFLLWALYFSIVTVGQRWYSFGWESQLLETGFLAIFMVPVFSLRRFPKYTTTPWVAIWGYRWLLFRIMIGAGMIKIRGDQCWRDLTCMNYHYQTQPVPNFFSIYFHKNPEIIHKMETMGNHVVELALPILLLLPFRTPRIIGAIAQIFFQGVLILSGNLAFLNWLTALPAVMCFDDAFVAPLFDSDEVELVRQTDQDYRSTVSTFGTVEDKINDMPGKKIKKSGWWAMVSICLRRVMTCCLGLWLAYLSYPVVQNILSPSQGMNVSFDSFRIVNSYGAFGSITKVRHEVILQGTSDRFLNEHTKWKDFEFTCKPGDINRRPCWISPYHLRIDWLMWFAAFQNYQQCPWLVHLADKLLRGDPVAAQLLAPDGNPFHVSIISPLGASGSITSPPVFVRAVMLLVFGTVLSESFQQSGLPHNEPAHAFRQLRFLRMSEKEGVDALVREYLMSRGYTKTAAELQMECSTNPTGTPANPTNTSTTVVAKQLLSTVAEDLYILGLSDKGTQSYFDGYDLMRTWAVNSIDIVKAQLLAICFPIFVHCYLSMVRLGFQDKAQKFLTQFRGDHTEFFGEELQHLCAITSQDEYQMEIQHKSNSFVSCALSAKFIVRLSSLAYNLLTLFLVQSDLVLIASIINNKIAFKKLNDSNADAELESPQLSELPGYTAGTQSSSVADFVPIPLGVPGSIPKIQYLIGTPTPSTTLSAAHITLPNSKDDELYRDLINKLVRPKAVLASLAKRKRVALSESLLSTNANINSTGKNGTELAPDTILDNADKLGAFSIEAAAVEVNELVNIKEEEGGSTTTARHHSRSGRERDQVGSLTRGVALEPSVIYATVTNSYEGMTCLDMNANLTQMATGHRDSSVRIWRLNRAENPPHFGRLLKSSDPQGEWTMKDVLPKTKHMIEDEARRKGSARGCNGVSEGNVGLSGRAPGLPMLELRGHSQAVYGVSQDNSRPGEDRLVLSCSADETVRLWDTAISQCVGKYACVSPAWAVAFSPLGYHFATANQDKTGVIFSTDRVTPQRLLVGHISDVNCVSWHPNATLVSTGSDDRTVRLWDLRTSHSVRLLRGSSTPISCTAISPLGNLLAAGSDSGKIYIWDLNTTRPLATLHGHEGAVHSVAFSADGAVLSSGGGDCSVRVWDMHDVIDTQIKLTPPGAGIAGASSASSGSSSTAASLLRANNSLLGISKTAYLDAPQLVLHPQNSFFTKFSPVFHVGFTPQNLLYAGGPFNLTEATAANLGHGGEGEGAQVGVGASVNEQDTVSALGIAQAVQAAH